jgi:hypothetical protein
MRRREAEEAVRMAKFLTLLHWWESAEFNQEGAARQPLEVATQVPPLRCRQTGKTG